MKKSILVLACLGMVTVLSGCPIWIDMDHVDEPECDWGCSVECYDNVDCGDGYICSVNGVCIPDDVIGPTICVENADCLNGYCEIPEGSASGVCVDTGVCAVAEDCAIYGPGLTCDERGICVPDEGPCPDGQCGCIDDTECTDGQLCIDSLCTDLATICIYDFECGGGTCIDNKCHAACDAEMACPTGQGCIDDVCRDLEVGTDGCVFDEDCGATGFRCINASCHSTCATVDECGGAEACTAGVCRADTAPVRECTDGGTECADGMSCVRGKCRMPCVAQVNCAEEGELSECFEGFCRSLSELDPQCVRMSDCANGASCFDGRCMWSDR